MSDPHYCAFCRAPETEMSGSFSNGRVTICHECVGRWLGVLSSSNPEAFEAMVTRARNFKPNSN